jgi:hypothetical protein
VGTNALGAGGVGPAIRVSFSFFDRRGKHTDRKNRCQSQGSRCCHQL